MERRMHPEPHGSADGIDPVLARLAEASRADSFDPGFDGRVMARIRAERSAAPSRPPARIRPLRWAAVAAAFVALATTALVLDGARWRTLTASPGETVMRTLPDGSRVTLHAGSTLRHRPFRFRSERLVRLEGEAFLDVAGSDRRFVVETFNADVIVTGTRFNVRAWPGDEASETAVALVEGSVVVRSRRMVEASMTLQRSDPAEVAIVAGETARVASGGAVRADDAPAPGDAANWTGGGLSFRDRPLADVLRALERRYAVRIHAELSVTRGRTATYLNPESPELADVLDALSFALGLRYGRTADGWILTPASPEADPTP
jgi:ferric-dicitrate binding protein FerR (iron transport regulator)